MNDIDDELEKIKNTSFFNKMGVNDLYQDNIILVNDVKQAFVEFSNSALAGYSSNTLKWLPSSLYEHDPFYGKRHHTSQLIILRRKINKEILLATRYLDKTRFICPPNDFSEVARNAICFAFRQLITEKYFYLGHHWEEICEIYYSGHWPIGTLKEKYIVI